MTGLESLISKAKVTCTHDRDRCRHCAGFGQANEFDVRVSTFRDENIKCFRECRHCYGSGYEWGY